MFVDHAPFQGNGHRARQPIDADLDTEDEYLTLEDAARHKSEWIGGEIRAMAGGSESHNLIAANTVAALNRALVPQGCRVYGSDMKVHTGGGANVYPDASVVCGPRVFYKGRTRIITNPLIIVEVLSPSTQDADLGEKWTEYQSVPSLQEYLLLSQDQPEAWLYARDGDGWRFQSVRGLAAGIGLLSVGVTLALSDLYSLVEWPTASAAAPCPWRLFRAALSSSLCRL